MTCIIGMAHEGRVYIGGDSMVTDQWNRLIIARRKVFRVGEFLLGCAGSIRMMQILQYHLSPRAPEEHEEDDRYVVTAFIEAVRATLRDHGYLKVENNREEIGQFLLGYRGSLYSVDADLQADRYANGIAAIGAGDAYALGAMLALSDLPPVERITRALEVSAELSAMVDGPFYVESIGGEP